MSQGNMSFASRNMIYAVPPESLSASSVTSTWIPVSNLPRICALIAVGNTAGTLDAKFQEATSAAGAGATDITGAAITQLTATDDDSYVVLDMETVKVNQASGFTHVGLVITAGGVADVAAFIFGESRHQPVTSTAEEVVVLAG